MVHVSRGPMALQGPKGGRERRKHGREPSSASPCSRAAPGVITALSIGKQGLASLGLFQYQDDLLEVAIKIIPLTVKIQTIEKKVKNHP